MFLPKFTSAEKEAAIRGRGAEVIRIDGDYDTAVAECKRQSQANGWTIISDTSWEGYDSVPRSVMRGYCVLAHEAIVQQWGNFRSAFRRINFSTNLVSFFCNDF